MRDSRSPGDFIRPFPAVCILMVPLLFPALLPGQAIEGSITGSISDATGFVLPGVNVAAVQDSRNRAAERALSDFDRLHAFTGSVSWGLPHGNGEGRRGFLLRNLQVNSILRIYSGNPFTPQLANYDFNAGEAKRPESERAVAGSTGITWFAAEDSYASSTSRTVFR